MKGRNKLILLLLIFLISSACKKSVSNKIVGQWELESKEGYQYSYSNLNGSNSDTSKIFWEYNGEYDLTTTVHPPNPISNGYTTYDTLHFDKWELNIFEDNRFETHKIYHDEMPYITLHNETTSGSWVLIGKDQNFAKDERVFFTAYTFTDNWSKLWNGDQGVSEWDYFSIGYDDSDGSYQQEYSIVEIDETKMIWRRSYRNVIYNSIQEGYIEWVYKRK